MTRELNQEPGFQVGGWPVMRGGRAHRWPVRWGTRNALAEREEVTLEPGFVLDPEDRSWEGGVPGSQGAAWRGGPV